MMAAQQLQNQRSKNRNDMPYTALQLIAIYNCVKASDALLVVGCVCKRWHDAAANYLPADVWRRFYDHLVRVHYQIPEKQTAEAKLPTPNTLQTYSDAARHWQPLIDDARALCETFRGVKNMPDSWKMHLLGTVAQWDGVKIESGRVTEVQLSFKSLQGSVDLTKLPAGLRILWLHGNKFSGSVDLTQLPVGLQELSLNNNKLSGSIDLTQLPVLLRQLYLCGNQLSGSVDLTHLPAGLQRLFINDNLLSGSIDLSKLPASLQQLGLYANQFRGSIDLTRLPASLKYVDLNGNQFSGAVDLTQLPAELLDLRLNGNQLSGSVDLTQLPAALRELDLTNNKFEGSTSVRSKESKVRVDDTVEIKK